jgi:hypothetical protein
MSNFFPTYHGTDFDNALHYQNALRAKVLQNRKKKNKNSGIAPAIF